MSRFSRRGALVASLALAAGLGIILLLQTDAAIAQGAGPFGVGAPEAGASVSASGIFGWIADRQGEFYKALTAALKTLRTDPNAAILLATLSFAYGVFHAAGPGHGKAVIASYIIANRQTLRRGIVLSFVSSFFQGVVAVLFVGSARFLFDVTAVQMTLATEGLELTSALMITCLGLWLVATKVFRFGASHAHLVVTADGATVHVHDANCDHTTLNLAPVTPRAAGPAAGAESPPAQFICADCGDVADPATLAGPFDWRRALGAIVAVGIRPCSGAIIVLVFAFSQRQYVGGILSVAAMALGTGITVAALATFAVVLKDRALRLAGSDGRWSGLVLRSAEVLAAFAVLAMGTMLLGASVYGTATAGG